jgi:gas vesicle protein
MGKTAEDLRYELEGQREALSRDFVAIGDRVSPGRMVERRRIAIRQSFGKARNAVMGTADSATNQASDGFAAAADRAGTMASSAQSTASNVGQSVGSAASSAADAVTHAPQAIQQQTQGNPLAAGLIAFGVGALAGTLLPTTRREEQAVRKVQPALESAASEIGEQAQVVAEQAKEQATQAAQQLKEEAQQSVESVKADAQQAADTVQSEARSGAESVKADAQDAAQSVKE